MILQRDQVIQLCEAAAPFADHLVAVAERCELDTVNRAAMFLAQVAHESGGFKRVEENLHYSKDALLRVFPKYFPTEGKAAAYANQPPAIASRIYANRMGNGDEASMDGWKYRGRGLIQVTGRENYRACSFWLFGDIKLLRLPELLEGHRFACESAGWFWESRNLNTTADEGNFEGVTRRINGGTTGLVDRLAWFNKAQAVLGGKSP